MIRPVLKADTILKRAALAATFLVAAISLPILAQEETVRAIFIDLEGAQTGLATLSETPEGVLIEASIEGLPGDQWVSFHIHEQGVCDPVEDFETAGEHFDPDGRAHGYHVEDGPHAGDMPNQYVQVDGTLNIHVFNSFVSLSGENAIRGLSLMIHDGEDDYHSQPAGEAGDRIACAVIE